MCEVKSCREEEGQRRVWARDGVCSKERDGQGKKRKLLKVTITSVAIGYCWFVPGVVNSGWRSTDTAIEAGFVSQMTSCFCSVPWKRTVMWTGRGATVDMTFFLLEIVDADCWVNELYKRTVIGVCCCTVSPHFLFLPPFLHTHQTYTVSLSHTFLLLLLRCLLLIKCISLPWL